MRRFSDLSLNKPTVAGQAAVIKKAGASRQWDCDLAALKQRLAYELLNDVAAPRSERIVLARSAKDLLAATVALFAPTVAAIAADELTYPRIKLIASQAGLICVGIPGDADGMSPSHLAAFGSAYGAAAVYLQPTVQNPLGTTMSSARRKHLAAVIEQHHLFVIEDRVLAFLDPVAPPPLAHFAPRNTLLVDSLSKRLSPSLNLGFGVAPNAELAVALARWLENHRQRVRSRRLAQVSSLIASGALRHIAGLKREDARQRNALAHSILAPARLNGSPAAYHLWLPCPEGISPLEFARSAKVRGVGVASGDNFAIDPPTAPQGVRIALGSLHLGRLQWALETLAGQISGPVW